MPLEGTVRLYLLNSFSLIPPLGAQWCWCAGADRQMQGSEIVWCIVVINDGC